MNTLIRTAAAAVLLFGALAANAKPTTTPTPQQRQAAQKLAGISVRILDLGQLFRYNGSEDSRYKPRPLQNSPKSPKFPSRHLGDFS